MNIARRWPETAARNNWRRGPHPGAAPPWQRTPTSESSPPGASVAQGIGPETLSRENTRGTTLATNKNRNDGHREGAVRDRSQFRTPSGDWAKRDARTGRILDVKSDGGPFKGVRRESTNSN